MSFTAIPTIYKGIQFKSRLEADTAFLFDAIGLKWQYEPQSFLLDNGIHYLPDFYLSDIKLWVECRGYRTEKGDSQINEFSRWILNGTMGNNVDYLVIGPEKCHFYDGKEYWKSKSDLVYLGKCECCNDWVFFGLSGDYSCRHCGAHKAKDLYSKLFNLFVTNKGLSLQNDFKVSAPIVKISEWVLSI